MIYSEKSPIFFIEDDESYFIVPGRPKGKQRPRFAKRGRFITTYTPIETKNQEKYIAQCWRTQSGVSFNQDDSLDVHIKAHFPIPSGISKKKARTLVGRPCNVHLDLDNIFKCYTDALNKLAYQDDSHICKITAEKDYVLGPGYTEVYIKKIKGDNIDV